MLPFGDVGRNGSMGKAAASDGRVRDPSALALQSHQAERLQHSRACVDDDSLQREGNREWIIIDVRSCSFANATCAEVILLSVLFFF